MGFGIRNKLKLMKAKKKWRERNGHNHTHIENLFPMEQVVVGKETYGPINIIMMAPHARISVGNYCSIGPGVVLMGGVCMTINVFQHTLFRPECITRLLRRRVIAISL